MKSWEGRYPTTLGAEHAILLHSFLLWVGGGWKQEGPGVEMISPFCCVCTMSWRGRAIVSPFPPSCSSPMTLIASPVDGSCNPLSDSDGEL